MEIGLYVIVALEMILINLLVVQIASKRRFAPVNTYLVLGMFSIALLILLNFLLANKVIPESYSGTALLLGFLYLIPYKYLYNQSLKYTFAITCTSWLYTLFMFSLSVRIASILNQEWFEWISLLTQTLLYVLTLAPFIYSLNKATNALRKIKDETLIMFIFLGSLWFLACILLNILFEKYGSGWLELLVTLLLLLCTILSYRVFYSLIAVRTTARELTKKTKTDALTGLKNREAFLRDAQKMIESERPFFIIFIDLDHFKQVNDRYGHGAGDQYLIHFASVLRKHYSGKGTIYRLSGDEFVFLYLGVDVDMFCSQLEAKINSTYKGRIRFRGLSLGYATYPKDGVDLYRLLELADQNMYQHKKAKHMVRG